MEFNIAQILVTNGNVTFLQTITVFALVEEMDRTVVELFLEVVCYSNHIQCKI